MKSHQELLNLLQKIKDKIKQSDTIKTLFKDNDISLDEIDLYPMCFSDNLDVSARTQHGIIYFNSRLLKKPEEIDHYMAHEITHVVQQTTGDGPTQGSTDDDYLENPYEIQGFQNQTEYLSETRDDNKAESYISKVLDHHGVTGNEREERKEELLQLAAELKLVKRPRFPEQLALEFPKLPKPETMPETKEELLSDLEQAIERGPQENHNRPVIKKLHPIDQAYRMEQLKKLLEKLGE